MRRINLFRRLFALLLADISVKVEQENGLILYIGEEVVVAHQVEHARSTESEEVRKSFAWLTVCDVPVQCVKEV